MNITVLIPHWKNGRMTAYCVSQLLKYKGKHELDIVVIDNNSGDGSTDYLEPFMKELTIIEYPKELLQSHGIAFDYVLPHIRTEWFSTVESDSFPISEDWLNVIEFLINGGWDSGGSLLRLSGGEYQHPAGAFYSKKIWQEAKDYCDNIPYYYFPNMGMKDGFASHLMVQKSIINEFLANPEDYVELPPAYKPYYPQLAEKKCSDYLPVVAPFHNGMGNSQESVKTYGSRRPETDVPNIFVDKNSKKIIHRVGYEPGQWLHFYMLGTGRKVFNNFTKQFWIKGYEGQQQEYSLMGASPHFKHIWAGSAYLDMKGTATNDIYELKEKTISELYSSLPIHQRIH